MDAATQRPSASAYNAHPCPFSPYSPQRGMKVGLGELFSGWWTLRSAEMEGTFGLGTVKLSWSVLFPCLSVCGAAAPPSLTPGLLWNPGKQLGSW